MFWVILSNHFFPESLKHAQWVGGVHCLGQSPKKGFFYTFLHVQKIKKKPSFILRVKVTVSQTTNQQVLVPFNQGMCGIWKSRQIRPKALKCTAVSRLPLSWNPVCYLPVWQLRWQKKHYQKSSDKKYVSRVVNTWTKKVREELPLKILALPRGGGGEYLGNSRILSGIFKVTPLGPISPSTTLLKLVAGCHMLSWNVVWPYLHSFPAF